MGLSVPTYRVDVTRPADVVEEILRVYGYNNIDFSAQLITSMPKGDKAADTVERIIGQQLANLGFFEIYNNSLVKLNESEADKTITIVNPLSQDLTAMRTNLFEGLVASMQYNINRKNWWYNVIILSTNGGHGLIPANRKFYWNSIENYFEPITYDSNFNNISPFNITRNVK